MAVIAQKKNKVVLGTSPSDALSAQDRLSYVKQALVALEYIQQADADDQEKLGRALSRFCGDAKVPPPSSTAGMGGLEDRDPWIGAVLEKFRKVEFRPIWEALEKALANHVSPDDRLAWLKQSLVTLEYIADADKDDVEKLRGALDDFCLEADLQRPLGFPDPNEGGMGGLEDRDGGGILEKARKAFFVQLRPAISAAINQNKHAPAWVAQFRSNPDPQPPADAPGDLDLPPRIGDSRTLAKDGVQYYYGFIKNDLHRKLLVQVRSEELANPTDYGQRGKFMEALSKKMGFQFKNSGLRVADMPSWVKLRDELPPQPTIWDGVELARHHDEKSWGFFADINGSTTGYTQAAGGIAVQGKRATDYFAINVFGPMVPFTVGGEFVRGPGDFGAYVPVRLQGTDDGGWLFKFGHLCEISRRIYEGRDHKVVFEPGTFLGTARTWIGLTTNPHCHITVHSPSDGCLVFCNYWVPFLTNRGFDQIYVKPAPANVQEAVARWAEIRDVWRKYSVQEAKEATRTEVNNRLGDYVDTISNAA